jgi:hypothetical protein
MSESDGLSSQSAYVGVPRMSHLAKKSRRMACPRCKTPMQAVVEIQPLVHEAGLIAYECPACRYVTSILWQPDESGGPQEQLWAEREPKTSF